MSDCDVGYVCVEGTCRSDGPASEPDPTPDGGAHAIRADAAASSTGTSAPDGASLSDALAPESDASADAAPADAAPADATP